MQTDERLVVECEYNTDLHDKATIRRWLDAFEQLIESVITDGEATLAALPMLGAEERILTLETWNATARDYPRAATLHALVSAAAATSPARSAVRCGDESLTYAELETRSTALAARLQAAGVKRGDLVGIHLERSCGMVPGLLAILKCGAAYVPMDPAFPAERLGFMVEDAHMTVILSQTSIHLRTAAIGRTRRAGGRAGEHAPGVHPGRIRIRRTPLTSSSPPAPPVGRRACASPTARW